MKALHMIAFVLVVIGGFNWGLVALGYNLVDSLLGAGSALSSIVYGLVGLSAIVLVATHKKDCRHCGTSAPAGMQM